MKRICAYCGQEFETKNSRKKFCDRVHTAKCIICGSEFVVPNNRLKEKDIACTCSKECRSMLRKQTNKNRYGTDTPAENEYIKDKIQSTNLEKYGTITPSKNLEVRKKISENSKPNVEANISTNLEKYGTPWPMQSEQVKEKQHETIEALYGVSNIMQSDDIVTSRMQKYKSETGYSHPFQNPEVKNKIAEINIERYGVEHPMQSIDIKAKYQNTILEKYGVSNVQQDSEIHQKTLQTTKERYGSECYLTSESGQKKVRESMLEKYGRFYVSQSEHWLEHIMLDSSKIDNFTQFKSNPKSYLVNNYNKPPTLKVLAHDLGVHINTAGNYVLDTGCQHLVQYVYSYMEQEVYDAIKQINSEIRVIRNTRQVITPYEIDLYLPDYNIGIECNPTATHNSSINFFSKDKLPTAPKYHQMKTELCEDKGIFLFHIFGYEWTHKREILISMLRNLLGQNEYRIYARNTEIRPVNSNTARAFLIQNHRQGYAPAKISLGLFVEDELVSLMTFDKMRHTIGKYSEDCFELVRFCSKHNTTVVGAASKLFSHFLAEYNPKEIISFSDRAHTRGNLYRKLGFTEITRSTPNYVWVRLSNDMAYHRMNAQTQNIKNFLHDDNIDLSKSESEIMVEHGFAKVYDSGTITWKFSQK